MTRNIKKIVASIPGDIKAIFANSLADSYHKLYNENLRYLLHEEHGKWWFNLLQLNGISYFFVDGVGIDANNVLLFFPESFKHPLPKSAEALANRIVQILLLVSPTAVTLRDLITLHDGIFSSTLHTIPLNKLILFVKSIKCIGLECVQGVEKVFVCLTSTGDMMPMDTKDLIITKKPVLSGKRCLPPT